MSKTTIEIINDQAVSVFSAEAFSGEDAEDFKHKLNKLIKSNIKSISIKFPNTKYIDSSGIGKLLFLRKKTMGEKIEFKITEILFELYEMLDSLSITSVIDTVKP